MTRFRNLLLVAIFSLSCDSTMLDPASLVDTLRVLAVQADKPLAEPGEVVHLIPLIADANGQGRPIQFAWGLCVNPGSQEIPDCAATISSFQTNDGSPFDVTIPPTTLDNVSPDLPIGSMGIVFAACAGTLSATSLAGVPVTCTDVNGNKNDRTSFNWGEKRVGVVRGLRNANPSIVLVRVDGIPWLEGEPPTFTGCHADTIDACDPSTAHTIRLEISSDSVETYLGKTEDVVGFFFSSQGTLNDDFLRPKIAADTTLHLNMDTSFIFTAPNPLRPALFWFVVRDDRGGVSFTSRVARVQ